MKTHENLTDSQKDVLGWCAVYKTSIDSEIFEFENSKHKDYEKFCDRMHYLYSKYRLRCAEANTMRIPKENKDLFNSGVYTGLVNHNKISAKIYFQ